MAYLESNGHEILKGQTRDPIRLEHNISKTAGERGLQIGNGLWGIKWSDDR